MYKITILPNAKIDIEASFNWYNSKQNGLGSKFIQEVRKITNSVSKNPKLFAIRYDTVRVALLKKFPFIIHFTIDEKTVVIIAVFHTSRNPSIVRKRK